MTPRPCTLHSFPQAIKEQLRKELEEKIQVHMTSEALDRAREEVEAAARLQLQVRM